MIVLAATDSSQGKRLSRVHPFKLTKSSQSPWWKASNLLAPVHRQGGRKRWAQGWGHMTKSTQPHLLSSFPRDPGHDTPSNTHTPPLGGFSGFAQVSGMQKQLKTPVLPLPWQRSQPLVPGVL